MVDRLKVVEMVRGCVEARSSKRLEARSLEDLDTFEVYAIKCNLKIQKILASNCIPIKYY
jgi:hypothetical protein